MVYCITGNTVSTVYTNGSQNGKLAVGNSNTCGGTIDPLTGKIDPATYKYITYSDGGNPCFPYFYPNDMGNTYDGTSRISPPGRMPRDVVTKAAGDEPWMDMIGNLHEAVLASVVQPQPPPPAPPHPPGSFDYRGYGHEYGSILYHKMQQTTARGKNGSIGGRCMRFK